MNGRKRGVPDREEFVKSGEGRMRTPASGWNGLGGVDKSGAFNSPMDILDRMAQLDAHAQWRLLFGCLQLR